MIENKQRQVIQNFLNCCLMETQGNVITHEDLSKLLDFYFSDKSYCEGLSCHKENTND